MTPSDERMDLFGNDPAVNLLPGDGTVNYYGKVLSHDEARRSHETLLHSVVWKNDEAIIFGKHIVTARKAAWYGDSDYPEDGSLLVMKDATQTNWLHSLPKSKRIKTSRINLTFRTISTAAHSNPPPMAS